MWNGVLAREVVALVAAQAQPAADATTKAAASDQGGSKLTWSHLIDKAIELLTQYGLRVVGAMFFLIAAWLVSSWLVRMTVRGLTKAHVDVTLAKFLSNLARWGLLVLVVIACLDIFGVPATSFVTVLGTVGLAIGLALQGSLSHMAAGIMLLLFRPFRVGDVVVVAGQRGTVDEIELFSTRLDTPDNRRVIIPNGQVFGAIIENITHHPERRVDVTVGVGYGADMDETRRILTEAAHGVPKRLTDRDAEIGVNQLGASSVDWQVNVWAAAADVGAVKQALIQRIKEGLDAAGIDIPYPQMVVHAGLGLGAGVPAPATGRVS